MYRENVILQIEPFLRGCRSEHKSVGLIMRTKPSRAFYPLDEFSTLSYNGSLVTSAGLALYLVIQRDAGQRKTRKKLSLSRGFGGADGMYQSIVWPI